MKNLRLVKTASEAVPNKYFTVYGVKEDDSVIIQYITPHNALYYKIENNILYIRATQKEGYSERVLYEDATKAKNGWYLAPNKGQITKAVIEEKIYPTSCARFFDGCNAMTEIENFQYLKVTKVCTSLWTMFQYCYNLQSVDMTYWDVSNVKYMTSMCYQCRNLTSVGDLSNWNTSACTNMQGMFAENQSPMSLSFIGDLSNWDTSKVTTMMGMFQRCVALTSIGDLSNWNVSKVTDMSYMFNFCNVLTTIGDLSNWDTSACTNMYCMFNECHSLTSVGDLSNWNVSKVTNMKSMFQTCSGLTSVGDLSNWVTSACTDMSYMFNECSGLTSVGDLSNWDTSKVTNIRTMFQDCSKLTTIGNLDNWNTNKVTDMGYMFNKCHILTSVGNLSNWNTSACTNMSTMFQSCNKLTSVGDLGNWNTSACTNMYYMFSQCSALTSVGDLSNWNTSACTNMQNMFSHCSSLTSVGDLSNWNVSKVTNMSSMFDGSSNFTVDCIKTLENWSPTSVTNVTNMFNGCGRYAEFKDVIFDLTKWNLGTKINSVYALCYYGPRFGGVDMSTWDMTNMTNWAYLFTATPYHTVKFGKNIREDASMGNLFTYSYDIENLYFADENTETAWKRVADYARTSSHKTVKCYWKGDEYHYDSDSQDWVVTTA